MTVSVQVLDLAVIGPLVRYVESSRNRAAVRVRVTRFEQIAVQFFVQIIDSVVERKKNQLRRISARQVTYCRRGPREVSKFFSTS